MSRRWIVVGLLFLGMVVSYIDRSNLSIANATIMRDLQLEPVAMGRLLSAFFWTYAVFQIPSGMLVDRFGIRLTYAVGFAVWSLASASIALARGPSDILASRLALGMAESVAPLASLAFIRRNFLAAEHGLPVSIYIAGQTLGPACGALLGSALLSDFGWRAMFAATGLGALLWIPFWLYFARGQPIVHAEKSAKSAEPSLRQTVAIVISSPSSWAMSACIFFLSYYWYFLLTWMPAYMTMSRGFSTLDMGRILSVPLFAMAFTNLATGWMADKLVEKTKAVFRVRVWFAACGLLGASAILILNLTRGRGPVLPILVISICSFGVASSNFWAIAQNAAPAPMVGRAIGYLNTLSQVAGAAAPWITGWSLGPGKNFTLAVMLAGLCTLVACACILIAGRGLANLQAALDHQQNHGALRPAPKL